MFTGLIESVGAIRSIAKRGNYLVLAIGSDIPSATICDGESICCDGTCLTVVSHTVESFIVEASQETWAKTIIGTYRIGTELNLERALKVGDRLGGHLVSGHVDCTGRVDHLKPVGESLEITVSFESSFDPLVVEKGSIAINGVSLTVNETRPGTASVNLIPFTGKQTTLGRLSSGSSVNVEFDIIGKYVARFNRQAHAPGLTMEKLLESGW